MAEARRFKVVNGPLSIRDAPNGERLGETLAYGTEIDVMPDSRTEVGGYVWWQHDKGWSAEKALWGDSRFMVEIGALADDEPRTFEVAVSRLSVREAPGGTRLPDFLSRGDIITTVPGSRTVDERYIWWQHDKGWSAESTVDGRLVYMREVFDVKPEEGEGGEATPPAAPTPPDHPEGTALMGVVQPVKVRYSPSTNPNLGYIRMLRRGESVMADFNTLTFADNYWWVKHEFGWTAWQNVDGTEMYLALPGTVPGVLVIGEDGPRAEDLPGLGSLILRSPVDIEQTQWFQYFGNNVFAYQYGHKYNYDGYSQGLHGGLDFGNSIRSGIPVYAGINATYDSVDTSRSGNFLVRLRTDDYLIIYQHIIRPRPFTPGQAITPDTVLAEIQTTAQGGSDHLHFEIRLLRQWIINPLLLMPDTIVNAITDRFNPARLRTNNVTDSELYYFYKTDTWTKWTTPLEQPMIKLGGDPVGPRYEGH